MGRERVLGHSGEPTTSSWPGWDLPLAEKDGDSLEQVNGHTNPHASRQSPASCRRRRRSTAAAFALSPIKDGLQQDGDGCDRASKLNMFSKLNRLLQRFGLSGCLAHFFVVSSSQEEDLLLRHLRSECCVVGRGCTGSSCLQAGSGTPSTTCSRYWKCWTAWTAHSRTTGCTVQSGRQRTMERDMLYGAELSDQELQNPDSHLRLESEGQWRRVEKNLVCQ